DQVVLFAKAKPLGEEEEVEFSPFGGLGEPHERIEFDVAARRWVTPHGGVVDAGEVRREVNLLDGFAHLGVLTRLRSGLRVVRVRVARAGCRLRTRFG